MVVFCQSVYLLPCQSGVVRPFLLGIWRNNDIYMRRKAKQISHDKIPIPLRVLIYENTVCGYPFGYMLTYIKIYVQRQTLRLHSVQWWLLKSLLYYICHHGRLRWTSGTINFRLPYHSSWSSFTMKLIFLFSMCSLRLAIIAIYATFSDYSVHILKLISAEWTSSVERLSDYMACHTCISMIKMPLHSCQLFNIIQFLILSAQWEIIEHSED